MPPTEPEQPHHPPTRYPELRSDSQPRRVWRLRVGHLHQPAHVRRCRDPRSEYQRPPHWGLRLPETRSPPRSSGSPPSTSMRRRAPTPATRPSISPRPGDPRGQRPGLLGARSPASRTAPPAARATSAVVATARESGGSLVCGHTMPTCAQFGDKCVLSSDCCATQVQCIDGFCARSRRRINRSACGPATSEGPGEPCHPSTTTLFAAPSGGSLRGPPSPAPRATPRSSPAPWSIPASRDPARHRRGLPLPRAADPA